MGTIRHEDKRFVVPNGEVIERLCRQQGLSLKELSEQAHVSFDTMKRVVKGKPKQPRMIRKIAERLGVEPIKILHGYYTEVAPGRNYTWADILTGAKKVADELFKDGTFLVDAILTFPGPGSLFTGMVLSTLPLKTFMRTPVYTAILMDAKSPVSKRRHLKHFHQVKAGTFRILVPRELTEERTRKIVVIDDTIITGVTMRELRKFFTPKYLPPQNVKFACCICHDAQTLPVGKPPEIIGLLPLERRLRCPMPWGRDSFCNEDAFVADEGLSATSPG